CGAMRACRRVKAWAHRQTSVGVVWVPVGMVCWSCFIVFSFHMRSLKVVFALLECHMGKKKNMKLFDAFQALITELKSATVVAIPRSDLSEYSPNLPHLFVK